jgi:hypothetical protein
MGEAITFIILNIIIIITVTTITIIIIIIIIIITEVLLYTKPRLKLTRSIATPINFITICIMIFIGM